APQQSFQLIELHQWGIVYRETRGMLELANDRMERAIDVIRRALIAQRDMRFIGDELAEGLDNARLADPRLSQKHKDLSFTLNRLVPAIGQQGHFLIPADEVREAHGVGGEAARYLLLSNHAPNSHRLLAALQTTELQFFEHEHVADEPTRCVRNQNIIRLRFGLEMSRKIGCLTDDCFFFGQGLGAVFTHDDKPGCDTDPDPNARLALGIRRSNSANNGQRRADCPLGIVFVGARITEKRHDAIANVIRDEALELMDRVGAAVVIATRNLIEIFGIERLGERCRTHDVTKENREVPSLAAGNELGFAWRRRPRCRRGETIRVPRSDRQAGTTASAKPTSWRVHSPALNAFGGQCGAALRAEAPTLRIIRVTAQAFHEAGPVAYGRGYLPISGTGLAGRSLFLKQGNTKFCEPSRMHDIGGRKAVNHSRSPQRSPSVPARFYFLISGQPPSCSGRKAWSPGTVASNLYTSQDPFDSAGDLSCIRYISCTMRPSSRIRPFLAKKSLTGMAFILATTVFASSVPVASMALR